MYTRRRRMGGGTKKAENLSNMIYEKVLETIKSSSTERAQFLFTPKGLDLTDDFLHQKD